MLAPAGDFERLRAAVFYGADAVYAGATRFGMRASSRNFSDSELGEAVTFAHEHGVKFYLTCNIIPSTDELCELPRFLENAAASGVDALIVTDLGVLSLARRYAAGTELHISTQAGVTNSEAARMLYELGARRVVAARELTLTQLSDLRAGMPTDMQLECFVHGSMCVSYSGRCLLSNYLTGRHSNKGDCSQPCRWQYYLMESERPGEYMPVEENESGTYILNSKDMCMIEHIPELMRAGISSFKIEGRAKTEYYTAVVTNAYRSAIDAYMKNPVESFRPEPWMIDELDRISHRPYCTGFYFDSPAKDAAVSCEGGYIRHWEVAAVVEKCENGTLTVSQRNRFFQGDELEVMNRGAAPVRIIVANLRNAQGEAVDSAPHPMAVFSFDCDCEAAAGAFIRRRAAQQQ